MIVLLKERDNLQDPAVDGNIKFILKKLDRTRWTGLIWLRIEISSGLFQIRLRIFVFHKMQGIS